MGFISSEPRCSRSGCKETSKFKCSKCKGDTYYCSDECMAQDYPKHKNICAMNIAYDQIYTKKQQKQHEMNVPLFNDIVANM